MGRIRHFVHPKASPGDLESHYCLYVPIPQTKFWKKIPEIQISENFKFWKNIFEKKKKIHKVFKILEIQIPETFPESYSLEKSQRVYWCNKKSCKWLEIGARSLK